MLYIRTGWFYIYSVCNQKNISNLAVIIGGVYTGFDYIEEGINQPFTATHLPSGLFSS